MIMSKDLELQERLAQFFQGNPKIWDDILNEVEICISNAEAQMKLKDCQHREYWAGYCNGLEEMLRLKGKYQIWQIPKQ